MSEASSNPATRPAGEAEQRPPLRLSLTLPGSASLGAFQAGATSVLGVTVQHLRDRGREVHVDAVGGASAGSLVALFFAHCLVAGHDVADVMHRAWVDEVDVDLLRPESRSSPLGLGRLRDEIPGFFSDDGPTGPVAPAPVALHIGLTNLLGMTYPIETADDAVTALTFVDWAQFVLEPDRGIEQLLEPEGRSPLDHAIASASHPGAFEPRLIDRSADAERYRSNGITNFPDGGQLWFSDGGLAESEPVGRIIQLARRQAGRAEGLRLHLVVDPRSSGPSGSARWGDPDADASWLAGMRRAMSLLPTQALHDDLRNVAAVNGRLDDIEHLTELLGPLVDGHDDVVEALARRLRDRGTSGDGADADRAPGHIDPDDATPAEILRAVLADAAGVGDKERIDVEVISPLQIARSREVAVDDLLAGDLIGAFGGFLSPRLRESDFQLGWAAAREWLPDGLARHDVGADDIDSLCERLDGHPLRDPSRIRTEDSNVGDLNRRERLRLARLAGRVGRILVGAATPDVLSRSGEPSASDAGSNDAAGTGTTGSDDAADAANTDDDRGRS